MRGPSDLDGRGNEVLSRPGERIPRTWNSWSRTNWVAAGATPQATVSTDASTDWFMTTVVFKHS